jgi:hypothetical protein
MKVVLDVLLLGFVPALLLGWHLDLRRARAERSSALNKDAAGGPQSPSEHTLLGEGWAGLGANCSGGRLDSVIFLSNVGIVMTGSGSICPGCSQLLFRGCNLFWIIARWLCSGSYGSAVLFVIIAALAGKSATLLLLRP